MARIDTLSIKLEDGVTAAELAEGYGPVIENVYANAISIQLKAAGLGDPSTGTVEFKRFENAASNAYGTARAAGAGVDIQSKPVVVSLDVDREIIEEVEKKDIKLYGVPTILGNRSRALEAAWKRELDTAFFAEAYAVGTQQTHTATTWDGKLEEMAVTLETLQNSFIDGIDRSMMAFVVTPAVHSALRLIIDDLPATDNAYAKGAVGTYHGVPVWVSNHLPKGVGQVVDAFCMMVGSIAQPVSVDGYGAERIPLSNAMALELFYSYGTDALTPETIIYSGNAYSAS